MFILGISAYYHDSAACLLKDGTILAAAQEERFTRIKNDANFPSQSIKYCLEEAQIVPSQLKYIVFYDKPFLKFERLLETYLAFAPQGFKSFAKSMPLWIKEKLFQKSLIVKNLKSLLGEEINWVKKLVFSEHHLSHAASAFFPSPFTEAAVLTIDGVGEWTTTSIATGKQNTLTVHKEIHFPHSLGLLYSSFTYYVGFKVNSGEYKLMGLAPYGVPRYVDKIKNHLIDIKEDGSFHLDISYFNYCTHTTMTNERFHKLFGGPPRAPEAEITQRHLDLAASIQKVTTEILIKLAKGIIANTGQTNLCLAGGVALNCVANGTLLREKIFDNIWVQPAAGDAGGALGAAMVAYHMMLQKPRDIPNKTDAMHGSFLGPKFSEKQIEKQLASRGAIYSEHSEVEIIELVTTALIEGKAISLMQGRMEFGPRALGARSIIADPRSPTMQRVLNSKVKYRESFRPFAPSVLYEDAGDWFEIDTHSPYMLFVANVAQKRRKKITDKNKSITGIDMLHMLRSEIPAVTHVDYSSRVQTVHKETNPFFYKVISRFKELTGCPVIVNTSFNIRGEPIVCTPRDAFDCFMGTELDLLIVGKKVLFKDKQNPNLRIKHRNKYELD